MTSIKLASAVDATIAVLKQSMVVTEAANPAPIVRGGRVPDSLIGSMPLPLIVVVGAGTPSRNPGSRERMPVSYRRIDVRCYGRSDREIDQIQNAVTHACKQWRRGIANRHHVFSFELVSGPVPLEDPDLLVPLQIVSFDVLYADQLV